MVRFICENCGSEVSREITCHGHKIRYHMEQLVCIDCSDRQLSDQEIEECAPKCCYKPMIPRGS